MKTFREFILICEKYNEEQAHRKLWNHFIAHSKHGKDVRDAILNKEYDKALELMDNEVQYAKTDPNHPLNFSKAKRGFSVTQGKQAGDEESYNKELADAVYGVYALATQKKMKSSVENRFPARVTGGSDPNAKLSRQWRGAGASNKTPKGDLEVYNPKNPKQRVGVSMKKGVGAQLASAEPNEIIATYKAAAKSYVQRFLGDKPKEERKRIQQDIMDRISRAANLTASMKTSSRSELEALKVASQDIIDGIHDDYPQMTRGVSQVSTSGEKKFAGRNAPGTAGLVLTGRTDRSSATAKPSEQQSSSKPRMALPKGRNRPGNLKVDYRPKEQPSREASFKEFSQRAQAEAEAQHAQTAAELEQQVAQAQSTLDQANKEVQAASIPVDAQTGEPVLHQFRKNLKGHLAADPTTPAAQINAQRRQEAQNNLAAAQNAVDTTSNNYQAHINTPPAPVQPPQPTSQKKSTQPTQQPQPTQTQQAPEQQPVPVQSQPIQPTQQAPEQQPIPVQTQQPPEQQPVQTQQAPEQQKPKEGKKKKTTAERMDAAGEKLGLPDNP